jgi:AcrR family transcriptional regulator
MPPASLRARQTAATRAALLDAAFALLTTDPAPLTHERVAAEAGAGVRTVYRHFPTQADLFQALWEERLRPLIPPGFPRTEAEIAPRAAEVFQRFEAHEVVVRALLASPAGMAIRNRGGPEGRAAFAEALGPRLAGRVPEERALIVAVFVAVFSSPFWEVLRDRGGLDGPAAQRAVQWTMRSLLTALHTPPEDTP